MRMVVAILCWATWLCAMVGIVAGIADDFQEHSLSMKMVGIAVFALYITAAAIGVKVFQTLWPKENGA